MLLGFRSRWTTPAEWTYFSPRFEQLALCSGGPRVATYQNLIEEVLDELFLERSRCEQAVEIGAEEFGDEVAGEVSTGGRCEAGLRTCLRAGK
jgi:hypothetical protein